MKSTARAAGVFSSIFRDDTISTQKG